MCNFGNVGQRNIRTKGTVQYRHRRQRLLPFSSDSPQTAHADDRKGKKTEAYRTVDEYCTGALLHQILYRCAIPYRRHRMEGLQLHFTTARQEEAAKASTIETRKPRQFVVATVWALPTQNISLTGIYNHV